MQFLAVVLGFSHLALGRVVLGFGADLYFKGGV